VFAEPTTSPTDITVPGSAAAPTTPVPSDNATPTVTSTLTPAEVPATPTVETSTQTPVALPSDSTSFWPSGRLPFRFSAKLAETWDDNIFIQPHKTSDFITQLTLKS
jgi:hypothetical protein